MDTSDIGTSDIEYLKLHDFTVNDSETLTLPIDNSNKRPSFRKISHDKLFVALLEGLSIESAASKAGVSAKTAHNIIRSEPFASEIKKARSEMLAHAEGVLLARLTKSLDTLYEVMIDEKTPPATKVKASSIWIDKCLAVREAATLNSSIEFYDSLSTW